LYWSPRGSALSIVLGERKEGTTFAYVCCVSLSMIMCERILLSLEWSSSDDNGGNIFLYFLKKSVVLCYVITNGWWLRL